MSDTPFECCNCGFKPSAKEVLEQHGACPKCQDTVIAFTVDTAEAITTLERELAQLQEQLDSWRQHAAESDREFLQLEDWLIGNKECDTKTGIINRAAVCKDRIRDLIAKEGELGDLQELNAELRKQLKDSKDFSKDPEMVFTEELGWVHILQKEEFDSLLTLNRELVEALKKAHHELNIIRARDGIPRTYDGMKSDVCPEYFSTVVDECAAALSKSAQMEGGK